MSTHCLSARVWAWLFAAFLLLPVACGSGSATNEECAVPCANGECPGTRGCDGCRYDLDCPSGTCEAGTCQARVPCGSGTSCDAVAGATVCGSQGSCVECASGENCDAGEICLEERCAASCVSDADCVGGDVCDPATNACVQCATDANCPEGLHCSRFRCERDVCTPGATRCGKDSNTLWTCNADGRFESPEFCIDGTQCQEVGGSASCAKWICEPSASRCSEDFKKLIVCDASGLKESSTIDCAAEGGACRDQVCADVICEPGVQKCMGSSIVECDETGTNLGQVQLCDSSEFCDDASLSCKPKTCTPNAPVCDGNRATICEADGSEPATGGQNCQDSGRSCLDGACADVVCQGTFYCSGSHVYACVDNGTSSYLYDYCYSNQFCQEGNYYCSSDVCGGPYCSGNTALTCKSDGSGPVDAGTPCGADVCVGGACKAKVCTPDTYSCSGGNVVRCDSTGTSTYTWNTCLSGQYCSAGASSCRTDVCTNGSNYCGSGDVALTCAPDGSGPVGAGTSCGDANNCWFGTCYPVLCTSGPFCSGGHPNNCQSNGTSTSRTDTCLITEHCREGSSTCQADVCVGGQPVCNGANLTTCAADGSGPVDAGQPCAAGSTCKDGACRAVICSPGTYDCVPNTNGDRKICNSTGTQWEEAFACYSTQYCDEATDSCVADRCAANAWGCSGETRAVCNSFGDGFGTLSTDCAATNQVCTLNNGCAASAVESAASGSTSQTVSYPTLFVEAFRTDKKRLLTQISLDVTMNVAGWITWVVYESATGYETTAMPLIHSNTTYPSAGSAVVTSGTLAIPLKADHYYYLGAHVANASSIRRSTSYPPTFVSFGTWLGRRTQLTETLPTTFSGYTSSSATAFSFTTTLAP